MTLKELNNHLLNLYPPHFAYEWDNIGIQIGNVDSNITKVLTCLEITIDVIEEALESNCNTIISHHPLFIKKPDNITWTNDNNNIIALLIKHNLNVISLHTNIDNGPFGLNDWLASIIDLDKPKVLNIKGVDHVDNQKLYYGLGRYGTIKPLLLEELAKDIKLKFDLDNIKIIGDRTRQVSNIAVVGGSGADLITLAAKKKCDVLITGDIKFHDAILAENLGIALIDAGHIIEIVFNDVMAEILREMQDEFEVISSDINVDPFISIT